MAPCVVVALLVCGCQSVGNSRTSRDSVADANLRNNAYSLLYDLLDDERHLSKLLIVKRDSRELNRLINRISDVSAEGVDRLKKFAEKDPSLNLKMMELPPAEQATRKAIAAARRDQLLGRSGVDFERTLLLTQIEALNYGTHLAGVAATNDLDPKRAGYLSTLSDTLNHLHSEVARLLFKQGS
jgi:hypothetical protein